MFLVSGCVQDFIKTPNEIVFMQNARIKGNLTLEGLLNCQGCINASAILNGTITLADLADQDCGVGKAIRGWANGALVCVSTGSGGGDITAVIAGAGLTGGGSTGDVTLGVDTGGVTLSMLATNSVDSSKILDGTIGAADLDASEVQRRVVGTCVAGQAIRVISQTGSVTCENIGGAGGSWSLTGNAGTSPASNFLGTTDNEPIVFRTNNAETMRLDASGNLDVSGTLQAGSADVTLTNSTGNILNAALVAPRAFAILQAHKTVVSSLLTDSEVFEFTLPADAVLVQVQVYCTAVTATASVDVREAGVTVLTSEITPTANSVVTGTIADTSLANGNALTVDVTTNLLGTITDLSVTLLLKFNQQP